MSKTAAGIIIGQEILTGKFEDQNGPFLIRRLRELGTPLTRLVVIDDDIHAISEEVRRCANTNDYVFTTGGVGPTHDDITFAGIARAFDRPLVEIDSLVELIRSYNLPINEMTLQMARVPEGSVLVRAQNHHYPTVRCENVWIFPGVPELFRLKFEAISEQFRGSRVYTRRIRVDLREAVIASIVAEIAEAHKDVSIGSYPRFEQGERFVLLTFEAPTPQRLDLVVGLVEDQIRNGIGKGSDR